MEPLGRWLKHEREVRQISLEEVALTTRIPLRTLCHLEEGRHEQLPSEVFVKGFLRSYARAVGLEADAVLARWSERGAMSVAPSAPALVTGAPPERGRRFGIAIALVILLILFTLALSIVLRPRHREVPLELSQTTQPAGHECPRELA